MQATDLHNPLVREHYVRSLEGTNNLLFYFASTVQIDDKQRKFPPSLVKALGLPVSITSMYDYRAQDSGIYERLYQHCVISLCSDIEFMFKSLFSYLRISSGGGRGFFQRFEDVIKALESKGISFSECDKDLARLKLAFGIRHISIHNFGIIDDSFIKQTGLAIRVGTFYTLGRTQFKEMFESYCALLRALDAQLPA